MKNLLNKIKEQKQINTDLYNSIPLPTREDPRNERAEEILNQWREGSRILKELMDELNNMKEIKETTPTVKTFVNSYGEATTRYITSSTYERSLKRTAKEISSFIGGTA